MKHLADRLFVSLADKVSCINAAYRLLQQLLRVIQEIGLLWRIAADVEHLGTASLRVSKACRQLSCTLRGGELRRRGQRRALLALRPAAADARAVAFVRSIVVARAPASVWQRSKRLLRCLVPRKTHQERAIAQSLAGQHLAVHSSSEIRLERRIGGAAREVEECDDTIMFLWPRRHRLDLDDARASDTRIALDHHTEALGERCGLFRRPRLLCAKENAAVRN